MKKFTLLFLTLTLVASSIQATDYVFRKKWDKSAYGNGGTTPSHLSSINYGMAYKGGDRLGGFSSGYGSSGIIYKTFKATDGIESASGWPGQTMPYDIGGGIGIDENGYFFVCNASYSTTNSCKIKVSRTAGSVYTYDVGSIPGLSPATTQSEGGTRVGYGIDVKRNSLGNGFLLITTSVSSYEKQEANTGVIYYPITGSDLAYPELGTPKKLVIPNLGVGVRVRIIDDTHFWIDGANTRPKLVTVTSWTTPTFTVAEFPLVTGGPNATVRTDVADFNFKGERFVLMGTDYVNHKAGVFKINSVTSTSISASNSIGEIGPLNTGSIAPHIISCATGVIDNSTNRKEAHLYVNSPNSGAISYIMEEAPAFNIIGTNGFPTSETVMTKTESATTGTLHFTYLLEEASAANPTFTIKHKNVLNADWHANNKLGATGLTNVTCTGCSLSGTTFTPSGDLANAGKSLKITVTYTDDLNNSTPTKVYAVKCEEVPYRITYDSKGGSNIGPQDYEVTTNLTLASSPTKYGYTFAGWKVKATKGSWTVGTVYSSNQNVGIGNYGFVTLEAQWTPNQHTLTLDPNGGSVTPTTYTGGYGTNVTIADATRTGYRFGGWLQTKTAYDATWAQVFYHYNNNGTILFTKSESDNLGTNSINDANKFSLFNVLDKLKYDATKYEFLLEYASKPGEYNRWTQTSNPVTTTESVTGYTVVDISWTESFWGGLAKSSSTNTFIDGSVNHDNWFYALGCNYNYQNGVPGAGSTENKYGRLWVRTADNFSNIGDSLTSALASDALTTDNKYIFRDEDATLKAIWMPNTYTVTYNGNGATGGSTANSSHIYNKPSALTTNGFTFDDHVFVGWSTTADGNVEYTDGQSVTNLTETHGATITLYAKWATAYRLHSGTGTTPECYSNELSYTGHFSLYHKEGNALTMQVKDEHDNWINLPGNIECSITNTVIKVKFTYATQILGTISEYTGDFFVRTAAANGGMDDYLNPYMDNKMSLLTGTAKYYWAKHANPQTAMKTIVGNLYNPQISATVCDGKELNDTSAIRVNYERTTNEVKMYQAKDKIASIGATNATIDSLMKCTFTLPTLTVGTFITTTTNITDMQAIAAELINTTLTGKRTRIVYDFATDSIFYSRLINNEMEEIDIANSDLVIVATDEATQTLFNPFYVANGRVIYERTFSNNKIWYWISLPYDVKISDVQGIPHYGTAWIMKKYNTQARANLSWGNDTTYWEILPVTATLNAHEGYLLGFENNYPMPSLLKFPSAYCSAKTTFNTTTSVTLPNYIGTHADKDFDANWHLVGSPLYSTSKVSGPEYIVTINATNTGYFYDRSSATTDLAPFTSFFVQYSGEENFTKQASAPSPAPLLQPKAMGDEEYYELVMTSPTYSEKTGIIMANDGSLNLYEQNKDLLMMDSWGKKYPQLYTCGASNKKMAFNHIAKATQTTLRVGIYVGQAETYTFSLSNKEVPAISVILRDKLLGIDTDLLLNDYTFNANTGYANSRFELIINRKADGTTGVLNTTDYAVQFTQNNGKLTISGVEPGTDIRLFDMAGRCIHQSKAQETTTLQSLPSGIYTAIVGTEAHKIVVK